MKTKDKGSLPFFLLLLLGPVIFLALVAALLLGGARVWQAAQKPILRHRVAAHCDALTLQAEEDLVGADGYTWTAELYIPESGDTVWYREASFGLAPSSVEYGYCYAADGKPHAYPGMENYDETSAAAGCRWNEPGGDNGCYVELIVGNLYYYEVWF